MLCQLVLLSVIVWPALHAHRAAVWPAVPHMRGPVGPVSPRAWPRAWTLRLCLRGGEDRAATGGPELYSWNGNLLQAVRKHGEVVKLLDLQSHGAIMWERGAHSASTLAEILSRSQPVAEAPSFLLAKVAPYIVPAENAGAEGATVRDEGGAGAAGAGEPEESLERSMAAAGLVLPPNPPRGECDSAREGDGHIDDVPPLPADKQEQVDAFLHELVPEDMRSNLEAILEQLKQANRQTYGDDLDRVLEEAANGGAVTPPSPAATSSTDAPGAAGTGAEASEGQVRAGIGAGDEPGDNWDIHWDFTTAEGEGVKKGVQGLQASLSDLI